MKRYLSFFLLLLIPAFILFFKTKQSPPFTELTPIESEKSFVFLIYSTETPKTSEQNISSILEQKYENYRIILMETKNLNSSINTIKTMIAKENKSHLLTILSFEDESPTIECFQEVLHILKNDEIVIQLECNDWLAHNQVLTKLNQIYLSNNETWLTYSQFLEYPSYQKGSIDPYMKKMLRTRYNRKIPWLSSPLKIYYASLFKQIKTDPTFNYKKPLLPETLDLYFLPLAEYSKNHIRFIDDVLYVHNTNPQ